MSSFHIGELQVKPEFRENLLASFDMLKDQSGFIAMTVYVSDEDTNKLTTVEEWESAQDHNNFMSSMSEDAIAGWMSMLAAPPVSNFYTKQ